MQDFNIKAIKKMNANFVSKSAFRGGASGRTRTYNPSVNRCDPSIFLWQKLQFFLLYICATILKTSGRRVCGRFVAENVAIFLPQAPSKRHEYMQDELDPILHMIMQFDPSIICHIKSKGREESKGDCAKAPRVISREEPFSLDKENCEVCT